MLTRPKVLFILPTFHAGGTENFVLRFVSHYKHEFNFVIWALDENNSDLKEKFLAQNATVCGGSIGYMSPLRWMRFYRFLLKENFDALCAMNGSFGGIPVWIARMAGVKKRIVWYRRSTIAFTNSLVKSMYHYLVKQLVLLCSTQILSNSHTALRNFFSGKARNRERFRVIPNGVDWQMVLTDQTVDFNRKRFNIPCEKFVIGHVGRFDPSKNHELIFRVAKALLNESENYFFVFCGKDTDSFRFLQRVQEHGLQDHVKCLGVQTNLGAVLGTLDVFYFPSVTEGQPNALIEAMLADLPIVPSAIDAIREAVPSEFYSKLVSTTDVAESARVLRMLHDQPESRAGYRLREFALHQFNADLRFNEFKELLK